MILPTFPVVFVSLLATLASASSLEARQSSECTLGQAKLEVPTNITNGEPFPVRFCSETYFKTSTKKIYFTWGFTDQIGGSFPVLEMTPGSQNGYVFNATVSYPGSNNQKIYLGVLELIRGYILASPNLKFHPILEMELNEIDGANPVVEMTPNWPTGYVFNATVSYPQIGGKIYLGVLEKINGYMVVRTERKAYKV
ncbi:hypothetical protein M408DRAFT_9989 [Serendipita vermifera MAFF 305830]|uniref:Uncharacterized protein n=1 Tax=Serendipita vermifera MAFF 305830 TaxID=933852 RepID=A0A0C3ANI9_SERVB|nr:hypothetical protein M408DRAFT_9989 [Serendipita vermifera MAFF 305830]